MTTLRAKMRISNGTKKEFFVALVYWRDVKYCGKQDGEVEFSAQRRTPTLYALPLP